MAIKVHAMSKTVRVTYWMERGKNKVDYYATVPEAVAAAEALPPSARGYVTEITSRDVAPHGLRLIYVDGKGAEPVGHTRAGLAKVYNDLATQPVKEFKDHATAVRRTTGALAERFPITQEELKVSAVERVTDENNGDAPAKRRGRAPSFNPDAVIVEFPGGGRHKRDEHYAVGLSLQEAMDRGIKSTDILWDIKNKRIVVED